MRFNPINSSARVGVLAILSVVAGCAATIPTELANARTSYEAASAGPAASLVPAELHQAQEALAKAEASFKQEPHSFRTRDLAYVAQRKAELAQALAGIAMQRANTASANAQYQAAQDLIMTNTRARLGAAQSDLTTAQSAQAETAAQLDAARRANAETAAQLSAADAGRNAAEAREKDTAAALAKLAAVKEESRGLVITLSGSVLFRSDEATLLPEAQTRLGQVTQALMQEKDRKILVEGHTDSQGSEAHNLDLSQRRADAVKDFLVAHGFDAQRVRATGIGEARPIADNATPEGRANNRRVEIILEPTLAAR